ncbi:MAG TPA: hypothetical protein ENF83_03140 [Candidatus Korarchaeota archaeon]|nr:hypothetical protein [Candidatus Korarchaeota archaeon]
MRAESTGFGYVVIDGKRYGHDVVLTDEVRPRRKELSKSLRSRFGHTPLTGEEILAYFRDYRPEVIVVGTGQFGALPLVGVDEAARELGAELIAKRTGEALKEYNRLVKEGRRVGALFHVTC